MSKKPMKPSRSTALAPLGQRKPPSKRTATMPAVMPATADTLPPALRSELAVAKLIGTGGEMTREGAVTLVKGRHYATREMVVPAEEVYYDRDARPAADGPWLGEADKLVWRDPATGYDCIMMRDTDRGFLSGYVGVPVGHPLWGWDSAAIPAELGIDVHGGIGYSRVCEHGPAPRQRVLASEARRICHVPPSSMKYRETVHATDQRAEDADVWWFGFECDQVYDLVPGDAVRATSLMKAEVGQTYRDDAYVVREATTLASQLRGIADDGVAPPRDGPLPPPLGLDPHRGGGRG